MADDPKPALTYAPAPRPDDLAVVRKPGEVRFEFGPIPTSLFVATLLPYAVGLAVVFGAAGWVWVIGGGHAWPTLFQAAGLWLAAMAAIWRLARHRAAPRVVGVTDDQLYYADARTGGQPVRIRRNEFTELRVYRSWWRPWVFELTTVPPIAFLGTSKTHPIVLLIGSDWRPLDRIRWELHVALGIEGGGGGGGNGSGRGVE